ncbi:MAG TPA: DUF6776 family protein [Methylophilaceae bacterium]|nr:DUF6776 family protein [Methylophilaceae bacterium]
MKRVSRKIKRHFGATAKHVAVRSHRLWYWQILAVIAYIGLGYLIAYWHLTEGDFGNLTTNLAQTTQDNQQLQARFVQSERQLQVAQAAQMNLARELANMQDESIHLKEDVAFYKNILNENAGANEVKLYSFKVTKGAQPNQYDYHILLLQSGRHDKLVQGSLRLVLNATQADVPVRLPLTDGATTTQAVDINFKYYQRIDGSFVVPKDALGHSVEVDFSEARGSQSKLNQKVDLPT